MDDLIYQFRMKAVNGNWKKRGPLVTILEALDDRIERLRGTVNENVTRTEKWADDQSDRLTALEESVGVGFEDLSLSDEVAGLSGEFARMTEERNKLLQRIIALEGGNGYRDPTDPCNGCAIDGKCTGAVRVWKGGDKPDCYREKPLPAPDPDVVCKGCAKDFTCPQLRGDQMSVKEIVVDWLKAHGYDGLFSSYGECACEVDDLNPCGESFFDCEAGHYVPCDPDPEEGCEFADSPHHFHIGNKEPPC